MNKKVIYWIVTILFSLFMIATAIPDVIKQKEAVEFIGKLGYPEYFVVYIGIAKIIGGITILIPGLKRLKEWAFAGLFFDLFSALISIMMTQKIDGSIAFLILPIIFLFASYYLWIQNEKGI